MIRPSWKRHAGTLSLVIAAVALVVGPLAAMRAQDAADRSANADVAELDRTGTAAALDRLDVLAADQATSFAAIAARLDDLAARLDATEARLAAAEEKLAAQARRAVARPVSTTSKAGVRALPDGDTFDALAACESAGDTDGKPPHNIKPDEPGGFITEFQFSSDTAAKVGAYHGMPYEAAKAAARSWASQVDPASRAGWPTCWPLVT
jgi:hypothetical protein